MKYLYLCNEQFERSSIFPSEYPFSCPWVQILLLRMSNHDIQICYILSGFSFTDTDDSQDSREKESSNFIPLYHFHLLTSSQAPFICSFLFICRLITRLLLDEIHHPISIWLNISLILPVDFMLHVVTVIFLTQVVDLNTNRLSL